MSTQLEKISIDAYFKKIETLSALSLYGQNVKIATHHIVKDVCEFAKNNANNPNTYLLALKEQLTAMANRTHPSMPGYKSTMEYAASLIVIHKL
ncbi:hypothetical protein LT85_2112 [Collimonas arenae]|uniref:Uncharacterized protein n=1 Tax=Collimonas arenae TaxID=279058 RepID=A0A0A1FC01_9BURK|nr:hypothetical protein [Collimonas arenae]AIY41270.1 hypothetical protein LT85_2112 [Collimonas arenae]